MAAANATNGIAACRYRYCLYRKTDRRTTIDRIIAAGMRMRRSWSATRSRRMCTGGIQRSRFTK